MPKKLPKRLVLDLILDDLSNTKLLSGLNQLGFSCDDYTRKTSRILFYIMDINTEDKSLDTITDQYCERTARVEEFAKNDSDSFKWLAEEIYNWMKRERKKYKKRLRKNN